MNNCKSKAPFFTIGSLDNCRIGLGDCCKCGDLTGDPRFLAWNLEENGEPAFHILAYFGKIIFGE